MELAMTGRTPLASPLQHISWLFWMDLWGGLKGPKKQELLRLEAYGGSFPARLKH